MEEMKESLKIQLLVLGALGCVADVSIPEKAENLINFVKTNLKSLDILVCNVGSGKSVSPLKETYYEWQRSLL